MPVDNFAVRWTKSQWVGAGRYKFTAFTDDGVRLYIDGKRVINQWQGPANTEHSAIVELGTGNHTIKMDYVEQGGGASAALSWEGVTDAGSDSYRAEYWNGAQLLERAGGRDAGHGAGPRARRERHRP